MATVKVYNVKGEENGQIAVPAVFGAPIRKDVVQFAWMNMKRNASQAFGVYRYAGVQCSAHSWGPGRAVARNPRKHGGIGAYANFVRGGHMFAPTQVTRRWHRKTNVNLKRYAVASAIAASQLPQLVEAHGHRVSEVKSFPLIVNMKNVEKTKEALEVMKNIHADHDLEACIESVHKRSGKGAMRNRRTVQKMGPLVIYAKGDNIEHGFRGIAGVTLQKVEDINLLNLAPGGHMGRFIIWTQSAFAKLDEVYANKNGFRMPVPTVKNVDLEKFIASEIMTKGQKQRSIARVTESKQNPYKCAAAMARLNPAAKK